MVTAVKQDLKVRLMKKLLKLLVVVGQSILQSYECKGNLSVICFMSTTVIIMGNVTPTEVSMKEYCSNLMKKEFHILFKQVYCEQL